MLVRRTSTIVSVSSVSSKRGRQSTAQAMNAVKTLGTGTSHGLPPVSSASGTSTTATAHRTTANRRIRGATTVLIQAIVGERAGSRAPPGDARERV